MKASLYASLCAVFIACFSALTVYGQSCTPTITAGGPTTFCAPGSVILSANTGAGFTYQWQKNNVDIPGATNATYAATTTGIYRVNLTAGPCTGFSNMISVLVSPTALISAGGNATFCAGGSIVLTAATGPNQTYQWRRYGTNINGATSSTFVVTQSGNYTCRVTNSCGTAVSNAILVLVQLPAAAPGPITTSGGTTRVCPGSTVTYSIAPVNGATSYSWTAPSGGNIVNGQGTTTVMVSYGAGVLPVDTLKVSVINSCGQGKARTLAVKRNDPVKPGAITGDVFGLCSRFGVPYSINPVQGMSYVWSLPNGSGTVTSGQGTSSITVDFAGGDFSDSIKVIASNGCGMSEAKKKIVRARPETPGAISGITDICANQQDVAYSISAVPSALNYTWVAPAGSRISDGVVTSGTNVLTTTSTSVTVDFGSTAGQVKVRARNSCGKSSNQETNISIVCRKLEQMISMENEISIYPNPAKGAFTISLSRYEGNPVDVVIRDIEGRIVHNRQYSESQISIEDNSISAGVYFVEVKNNEIFKVLKLVINK